MNIKTFEMVLYDIRISFIGQVCWGIPGKISNLEASTQCFLNINTETLVCRCLPSRSVFLRSIFKLRSAGMWLKLWSMSRGKLRVKAGFSPRMLCPLSLVSWNTILIGDHMWHHKTTHISTLQDLNSGSSSCSKFAAAFNDDLFHLQHRCWICLYQLIQATGTPNGINVFPRFYYISGPFSSTAPVHPDGFVLSIMAACSPLPQR